MSITMAETRDPATLVSPETYQKLVDYAVTTRAVTRPYAERGVGQMLVYMKACASNPGVQLSPDHAVDPFGHIFQLHTLEFEAFEREHAGGKRLRHTPTQATAYTPEESQAALAATVALLEGTGYAVDREFWTGQATCGQGTSP